MRKAYLAYELETTFGVNASHECNATFFNASSHDKPEVIVGANEFLAISDPRKAEIVRRFYEDDGTGVSAPRFAITRIAHHGELVAAGCANGAVRIWRCGETWECVARFYGHRAAVTALAFSPDGHRLASGSKDTDIVVWDVVARSGLFRLQEHRNEISDLKFVVASSDTPSSRKRKRGSDSQTREVLVSSSKDTTVKIWDLETQWCVQTLTESYAEVRSVEVHPLQHRLFAAASDKVTRVYDFSSGGFPLAENEDVNVTPHARLLGQVQCRSMKNRLKALTSAWLTNEDGSHAGGIIFLSGVSSSKVVEVYRYATAREAEKRFKRRKARAAEKLKRREAKVSASRESAIELRRKLRSVGVDEADMPMTSVAHAELVKDANALKPSLADEMLFIGTLSVPSGVSSFQVDSDRDMILVTHPDNTYDIMSISLSALLESKGPSGDASESAAALAWKLRWRVAIEGHQSVPRVLAANHTNTAILSVSKSEVKTWTMNSFKCSKTIALSTSAPGTSGFFVAGDAHAVVGTAIGTLLVVNLNAAEICHSEAVHSGKVHLAQHPQRSSFVSASADKTVKVMQLLVAQDPESSQKIVKFKLTKEAELSDEAQAVAVSPNGSYVAVALLNNTVQVFFADSMRIFLQLYGHQLPVTCISIASDSTLLASGSIDKTVKIWGLDYGNIQKSWIAHADAVTDVRFLADTHYIATCGRDGTVKLWDTDNKEQICRLLGHIGPVIGLCFAEDAAKIFSCGEDRSIRVWQRTGNQIFLDEEREKEMEAEFEKDAARQDLAVAGAEEVVSTRATRTTLETIRCAERLIEVIDDAFDQLQEERAHDAALANWKHQKGDEGTKPEAPPPKLQLLGRTPLEHVMESLNSIPASCLHEVLIALPLLSVEKLIGFVASVLDAVNEEQESGFSLPVEAMCKAAVTVVHLHYRQFISSSKHQELAVRLQKNLRRSIRNDKSLLQFNLASMAVIRNEVAQSQVAFLSSLT